VGGCQDRLAIDDIVCMLIRRVGPSVSRGEILQQLDPWSLIPSQCCDAQTSAEYVVQVLLLSPEVLAFTGDSQAEQVVIKPDALLGAGNHDSRMVDPQKRACLQFHAILRALYLEGSGEFPPGARQGP